MLKQVQHDEFQILAQPLQRSTQPFGFRGLGVMVGTRLFDRFRLGALREVRIGETRGEAVAFLLGSGRGFGEAGFFRFYDRLRP